MCGGCATPERGRREAVSVLACRLTNYGRFEEAGWKHLQSIDVRHVFIRVPPPDEVEAVGRRSAEHGLTAVVMGGRADLSQPACVDDLAVQLRTCARMGVKYMFLSAGRHEADRPLVYERLRQAGDIARMHGVTIVLETHPDLGTNGDVHLDTMRRIDHPNVRVNFDTGNIHFYNRDADAPTELKKIVDYVATVELKDHNGQYQTWNFPPLGKGVVDIPGVLRILREHGYSGPLVMEIEGVEGIDRTQEQIEKDIKDSAAYVRSLGRFE